MPRIRKSLAAAAVVAALAATLFAAVPAQAADVVCSSYCWTLRYPQDCQKACKLADGSWTTCGQYLGHPQCGWLTAARSDDEAQPAPAGEPVVESPAACLPQESEPTAE